MNRLTLIPQALALSRKRSRFLAFSLSPPEYYRIRSGTSTTLRIRTMKLYIGRCIIHSTKKTLSSRAGRRSLLMLGDRGKVRCLARKRHQSTVIDFTSPRVTEANAASLSCETNRACCLNIKSTDDDVVNNWSALSAQL